MAAAISAQQVKALRDQTGCGMMECKNALVETNGDIEKIAERYESLGGSNKMILTTEKDATRLLQRDDLPQSVKKNIYAISKEYATFFF